MPNFESTYIAKDTDIDQVIEIFGGLLHQLNYLMKNLDSKNVRHISTNSTTVQSDDGTTQLDGSQLMMCDFDPETNNPRLRLKIGLNQNTGDFEFALFRTNGTKSMEINSDGEAVFKGDIRSASIQTTEDIYVGKDIYLNESNANGTNKIAFFVDPDDTGHSGFTDGVISVTKPNQDSRIMNLSLKFNTIGLNAGTNINPGQLLIGGNLLSFNGNDIILDNNAYQVEIDGVMHTIRFYGANQPT